MTNKSIFFGLLFLLLPLFSFAQSMAELALASYEEAAASIVVLKNEQELLPLKNLHELKVAYLSLGGLGKDFFYETLQKYMPVDQINFPYGLENTKLELLEKKLTAEYNTFIFAMHETGKVQNPEEVKMFLQKLITNHQTIAVQLGAIDDFRNRRPGLSNIDAVIYAPQRSQDAASLSAQIIFGGAVASGRLEQAISPFSAGEGLDVEGGWRLGYAPAESVGMDGDALHSGIARIVQEGLDTAAFPGCQVLVAKDGKVIYHETFGYHTYAQAQPLRSTDIYDFASLTKVTTSLAALMKLYGDGDFDLDAPLERYLPYFENSNKGDLTFRAMLAHNARLRPWIPYWRGTLKKNAKYPWQKRWSNTILNDGKYRAKTFRRDSSAQYPIQVTSDLWLHYQFKEKKIYKAIKKSPLNTEPGYKYSGLLFYLLPDLVSQLTESDFETYLNTHFYHRIGAYTLGYNPLRHFPATRIIPTERDTFFRMKLLHGTVHDEGAAMMDGVSSNAGLFGSANDLAKLFQLYMNYGSYGGEQLIAKEAVQEFIRCQYCEEGNRRGLGFDKPLIEYDPKSSSVAEAASPLSFGHSGYTGTFAWADPEHKILYIFFSNRVHPTRDNPKIYRLNIRPRIHEVIYEAVE